MDNSHFGFRQLKRIVPAPLKRVAKEALTNRTLRSAVRQIRNLPIAAVPSRAMLQSLQRGWANEGFAAETDYLEEVARAAASTTGPILECGSGLTTILLGLLAGRRGIETWSLEHIAEWRAPVVEVLEKYKIPKVHVCLAPLRAYHGFSWYDPPLAHMPNEFRLVICDGPPSSTPGGRYGLLPVMRERLASGSVIVLDDAQRSSEGEVLRRWTDEAAMTVLLTRSGSRMFATVTT